ncbi:hypothetical protein BST61_g9727 [Cercospora zeina]
MAGTESYMMFVDDPGDYSSLPSPTGSLPPPAYGEANASSSKSNSTPQQLDDNAQRGPAPCAVQFFKGNGITSKARLVSVVSENDGSTTFKEFRLVASIHKTSPSIIKLHVSRQLPTLVQGEKHNAELTWQPGHPRNQLEEIVVVLRFLRRQHVEAEIEREGYVRYAGLRTLGCILVYGGPRYGWGGGFLKVRRYTTSDD